MTHWLRFVSLGIRASAVIKGGLDTQILCMLTAEENSLHRIIGKRTKKVGERVV
jgi:hypothetical protein